MATRRVSFSIGEYELELLQAAAARAGSPLPAWLARTAVQEAIRQGWGPTGTDHEAEAIADDADLAAAEAERRATG